MPAPRLIRPSKQKSKIAQHLLMIRDRTILAPSGYRVTVNAFVYYCITNTFPILVYVTKWNLHFSLLRYQSDVDLPVASSQTYHTLVWLLLPSQPWKIFTFRGKVNFKLNVKADTPWCPTQLEERSKHWSFELISLDSFHVLAMTFAP